MKQLCLLLLVLLVVVSPVASETGDGGTESVFSFGVGARELALGGAAVADADAVMAPFWNPSRLAQAEHFALSGFHMQLFDSDAAYQYVGAVLPTLDYGSFGIGVFRLGVDGINVRDASNVDMGETNESRMALYLSYGKTISDYDLGLALTMQHQSLGEYSATSSPGINLSIGRSFYMDAGWLKRISLVAVGSNIIRPQTKLLTESIKNPMGIIAGFAADFQPGNSLSQMWTLSASVKKVDYTDMRLSAGVEVKIHDLLQLRGGLQESRSAFGVGIDVDLVKFDYAMIDRELGSLHTFTLTTSFGKPTSERRILRAQKREEEFNQRMVDQFEERNRLTISRLVSEGKTYLNNLQPASAIRSFDGALFLARGMGIDTTDLRSLADTAITRLEESNRDMRFTQNLDSAQSAISNQNFVLARYFAGQALEIHPREPRAARLLADANAAIQRIAARDQLVTSELKKIDSLLDFGHVKAAMTTAMSLGEYAPKNSNVQSALQRTRIEYLKQRITESFASGELNRARELTDSALVLHPSHRWFTDISGQINDALSKTYVTASPTTQVDSAPPLSDEIRRQVEAVYVSAREAFEAGDLRIAIAGWERVEAMAPDYASVREYLTTAYKFVGVEYYGQNELTKAVDVWKAAQRLNPENTEIREYIRRTESEIRKLKELSYEP